MCSWRVRHQQVRRTHGIPISLAAAWGPLRATEGESKRQKDHSGSDHSPQKDSWQQFSTVFMVTYVTYVTLKGWTDLKRVWMIGMIGEGFGRIPGLWTILNMWISFVIVNTVKTCLNYLYNFGPMNWIGRFHSCILNQNHLDRQLSWFAEALNHWKVESGATLFQDFFSKDYLEHKVEHLCTRFGCLGYFGIVTIFLPGPAMSCNVQFFYAALVLQCWPVGASGSEVVTGALKLGPQHLCDDETWHPSDNPWDRVATESNCHVMSCLLSNLGMLGN